MRRTTTTALTATLLFATLSACGSSSDGGDKPADPTKAPSPTAKAYTYKDCVDLITYDLTEGEPQDASDDAECSHLSKADYDKAASEALLGQKDEILDQASREAMWDAGWDALDPTEQQDVCDLIEAAGTEAVATHLKESSAQPAGHETEMAEYYRDKKC